jgi:hypothetical protein
MYRSITSFLLLLFLSACQHPTTTLPENYSLTLCVEAHGLDYTSTMGFIRSMACSGNFGHAWIELSGPPGIWIGGHSGELGRGEATYFEGIMDLIDCDDPNPIRYLWSTLKDGYCEKGSGGHRATYKLEMEIDEASYWSIIDLIEHYPFSEYSLSDHQCCSFVINVARVVGIELDATTILEIDPVITFRGERLPLWKDAKYHSFQFSSPEALQASMKGGESRIFQRRGAEVAEGR